jgi:mono/diheme cytochrome c family protein
MRRIWIMATGLLLLGLLAYAQESKPPAKAPAEFKIPPEAAARENPVKPTPAGNENAKRIYGTDCEVCHGKEGDGKGELAADMKVKMRDWRDAASLEKMTDGEIFYIITKGKGEMTGEADRFKPEQYWQLVNYVRSFAKKDPAVKKPDKPQ